MDGDESSQCGQRLSQVDLRPQVLAVRERKKEEEGKMKKAEGKEKEKGKDDGRCRYRYCGMWCIR